MKQVCRGLFALAVIAGSSLLTISMPITLAAGRGQQPPSAPPPLAVPADLKPLLVGPASDMRLVVTRYQADRNTLAGNFAGPGPLPEPGPSPAPGPDPLPSDVVSSAVKSPGSTWFAWLVTAGMVICGCGGGSTGFDTGVSRTGMAARICGGRAGLRGVVPSLPRPPPGPGRSRKTFSGPLTWATVCATCVTWVAA